MSNDSSSPKNSFPDTAAEMSEDGSESETIDSGDNSRLVPIDRRTVLGGAGLGLGLGAVGYLLADSSPSEDTPAEQPNEDPSDENPPDEHLPFDIWSEMQAAFRSDPSHLPGSAQQRIETANGTNNGGTNSSEEDSTPTEDGQSGQSNDVLETLFEFVRDEVQTVPTRQDNFDSPHEVVRWGGRGALRCGMGTPRDKALLLIRLYRDAGFEAELRQVSVDREATGLTDEQVRENLLTAPSREGDPGLDTEDTEAWAERLDVDLPDSDNIEVIDEDGEESFALAESLKEVLPEDAEFTLNGPSDFDWRWDKSDADEVPVPVVEVSDGEETYYANLFGDVPFGETGSESGVEAPADPEIDTVRIELSAATPNTLEEPFELVSGEWEVPDLVGRQLLVRTAPTLDFFEYPGTTIEQMTSFIPTLGLQGLDMTAEEQAEHSEFGDLLMANGEQVSVDTEIDGENVTVDGPVERNGNPVYDPENPTDPSTVDTLDVEVSATNYPWVRMEAQATDEDGEHVTGLPASAFAATDEDQQVVPVAVGTVAEPEILVIRDTSRSIGNTAVRADWDNNLVDVIEEVAPGAEITHRTVDSAMWTHLSDAIAESPDLIVYFHDGADADSYNESLDDLYAEAPPTILVSTNELEAPVEADVVLQQADLTGAEVVPFDQETVTQAVEEAIEDLEVPTYRFDYRVPDEETGTREAELSLGENPAESPRVSATDTYEATDHGTTRSLVGLYLTIEFDGREKTRTLGGWDPLLNDTWDPYNEAPDQETGIGMPGLREYAEDTRRALLGGVDISFEGDGVPTSVFFDDRLEGKQTFRDLHATVEEMDIEEGGELTEQQYETLSEVWEQGTMEAQWDPLFVQGPLPDRFGEDGLTYFLGPRMVAYQAKPDLSGEEPAVDESLDVIPLSMASTATDDPTERFFRTLERTARIAVLEDAEFETSTLSLIGDTDIVDIADIAEYNFEAYENSGTGYYDLRDHADFSHQTNIQFGPTDGSELAMWNVHTQTGTVYGLLPDGTGGAKRRRRLTFNVCEGTMDQFAGATQLFLFLIDEMGIVSSGSATALGILATYYLQLSLLYIEVTAVVGSITADTLLEGPGMGGLADVAIETAKSAAISEAASNVRGGQGAINLQNAGRAAGVGQGSNNGC